MISPSLKLYRLRGWFFFYFVLKSAVGAVVAASVLKPEHFGHWGRHGWRIFPPGSLLFFSLAVAALILVIALLVFGQLLLRKNWARVLLLVIGWLTVLSAVFSLLGSARLAEMGPWMARWLPEMDWEKLLQFDRIQKIFELLFWGYLIAVLQFDHAVRDEFFPPPPAAGQSGEEEKK